MLWEIHMKKNALKLKKRNIGKLTVVAWILRWAKNVFVWSKQILFIWIAKNIIVECFLLGLWLALLLEHVLEYLEPQSTIVLEWTN